MDRSREIIEFIKLLHNYLQKWIKSQREILNDKIIAKEKIWEVFAESLSNLRAKIRIRTYPQKFNIPSKKKVGKKQWNFILRLDVPKYKCIWQIPQLREFIIECQRLEKTNSNISAKLQKLFLIEEAEENEKSIINEITINNNYNASVELTQMIIHPSIMRISVLLIIVISINPVIRKMYSHGMIHR